MAKVLLEDIFVSIGCKNTKQILFCQLLKKKAVMPHKRKNLKAKRINLTSETAHRSIDQRTQK